MRKVFQNKHTVHTHTKADWSFYLAHMANVITLNMALFGAVFGWTSTSDTLLWELQLYSN